MLSRRKNKTNKTSTETSPPLRFKSNTTPRTATVTATGSTSGISTVTVTSSNTDMSTISAASTTSGISTVTVTGSDTDMSTITTASTTSGIPTITVTGTDIDMSTISAANTTSGISTVTVTGSNTDMSTISAASTTSGIPTITVTGTDIDMSTITAASTTSGISTVTVTGSNTDMSTTTATGTTSAICAVTFAGATTSTTSVTSADHPTVVGYPHNVSPMKRNKKDTLSYATFTLQLDKTETCDALCYSKSKQLILADKELSRSPVKITKFTRTQDRTKLVINDITHVTPSNSLECPFQFNQNLNDQTTTTLGKLDQAPEDKLTVICKIVQLSETKIVGQAKYKVANTTIADQTAHITLDVWNDLIPQIQENKVYKFTHLSVRFWNGIRKLTTTTNTIISEAPNSPLHSLQVENISTSQQQKTLNLSSIESIESLEKFKVCAHCGKRIIQVQDLFLKCDHCHHKMKASKCPTKLTASIVVKNQGNNIYLTIRDDVLQKLFGPYDANQINTTDVEEKLLLLENIAIMYTHANKVTAISSTPMES